MRITWLIVGVLILKVSTLAGQSRCLSGNCIDGIGKKVFKSGAIYEGRFVNGQIQGKGTLYFSNGNIYSGDWQKNYRQGQGQMDFANGDIYKGQYFKSKMKGKGTMSYSNGDVYEGDWSDDQKHGRGAYSFTDGKRYEGEFQAGKIHGTGTMYYANGNRYTGDWKNNQKDGTGKFYKTDGSVVEGTWQHGKMLGGTDTQIASNSDSPSGNSTSDLSELSQSDLPDCTFGGCDGVNGVYNYSGGAVYIGMFKNGKPEGEGVCYYEDGNKYVGEWKLHAPHGIGTLYYHDGRVVKAEWYYGQFLKAIDEEIVGNKVQVDEDAKVKVWAVLVGVSTYTHMARLNYTDDDAYQIYAFLKSPQGGSLPDNQIRILIDGQATRANILKAAQEVFLKADENDVVLFYFSGHGLEGAFVPVDYDGFNNRLSHDDLSKILKQSRAKHKICLADACHSGSMLAMKSTGVKGNVESFYQAFEDTKGGLALLMSSKSEETSLEDNGLRHGVFSHFLIQGLKGKADSNKNKIITITEIYSYVYQEVRRYTAHAQSPTLTGDYDKDMPIAIVP